jgi:hypothetical protein
MATSEHVALPQPPEPARGVPVKAGRLPVSELAADRPGGPSPVGDDVVFPLPVDELRYTHTVTR